eukprot:scaffold38976_cov63-Phaeocystis_antarctica.AAC.5
MPSRPGRPEENAGGSSRYSSYRHFGTARRCGAVRSKNMEAVRSQRSRGVGGSIARRPKHHSGLE